MGARGCHVDLEGSLLSVALLYQTDWIHYPDPDPFGCWLNGPKNKIAL